MWQSAAPTPGDLISPCSVTCGGFTSLRPECQLDACLANNLCRLLPGVADGMAAAGVSHRTSSVLMVLMGCLGIFCAVAACYYHRQARLTERDAREQAMSDAIEAASSGPSRVLTSARQRLAQFSDSKSSASGAGTGGGAAAGGDGEPSGR